MEFSFIDINGTNQVIDSARMGNRAFNVDCMVALKATPDKYFELCICDPPYGIGISGNPIRQQHKKKSWDDATPNKEYFNELRRVSKYQIIWGGNYFDLPPCKGYLIWDKEQPFDFSLAMCEFAWCNIDHPAKMFRYRVLNETNKIHPTQKPVALYEWLLKNYAKPGDRILDTHLGSGSSRIAAYNLGFDFVGYEIDKDYFDAQEKRFAAHISQVRIFDLPPQEPEQTSIL